MATYKVIQDIEAEDKFIGPLTLKQFVFAMGGAFFGYLTVYFGATKGQLWAMPIFVPPMLLGFFLAIPWSKYQPTDVWVLAKLRFKFKQQKRIWDQAGLQELVTITVPKKEEKVLTKNYSEGEVRSRLSALADTLDSRGWAVKHVDFRSSSNDGERLVDLGNMPAEVPDVDLGGVPDMMDEAGTPQSAHIDYAINTAQQERLTGVQQQMAQVRSGLPAETPNPSAQAVAPPAESLPPLDLAKDGTKETGQSSPASQPQQNPDPSNQSSSTMTTPVDADIIGLAQNNDLDVATIQRQGAKQKVNETDDEVSVSLH